jgi:acyl carrier protein
VRCSGHSAYLNNADYTLIVDSKKRSLVFDDVADFVRAWARVPIKQQITPETQFERDLGITGDDGSELLDAAGKHFMVNLASDETGYRPPSASAQMNTSSTRKDLGSALQ